LGDDVNRFGFIELRGLVNRTISSCFKINSNFSPFIINFHKHFKNVDDPREFDLV